MSREKDELKLLLFLFFVVVGVCMVALASYGKVFG